ncbi:MAG: 7-cyano-7-deazaguanine synthase QueC [Candidatus Cloacimonadota bacterium]|nr:7-cyano-7-deazaguanine synthase QueC [Candidatus Cloacimonadota bacterium]
MKKKAIVLISGGLDSLVTAAVANKDCDEINFLHLNYGQLTHEKELEAFHNISEFYQPKNTLLADISYLQQIGGSSLIDDKIRMSSSSELNKIPNTYVPFRNAHLLSIAVSWAEVIEANRIYIGAMEEDSSGYPDCRESFYRAFQKAIDLGTKDDTIIEIKTPIIHKHKSQIVMLGKKLKAPLHYSWSCYKNNQVACGVCESCKLRIRAFKEAGIKDPILYQIEIDW